MLDTRYVLHRGHLVSDASNLHPDIGCVDWLTPSGNEFAGDRDDFVVGYSPTQQGQQRRVAGGGRAGRVAAAQKSDDRRQSTGQSHPQTSLTRCACPCLSASRYQQRSYFATDTRRSGSKPPGRRIVNRRRKPIATEIISLTVDSVLVGNRCASVPPKQVSHGSVA
jgi:hypothetical protein